MEREDAVRSTYDAYNARDLPRALAHLSADVEWDDGEGNMLHGKDAVARHWADQWRRADAKVEIEHLAWHGERAAPRRSARQPQPRWQPWTATAEEHDRLRRRSDPDHAHHLTGRPESRVFAGKQAAQCN